MFALIHFFSLFLCSLCSLSIKKAEVGLCTCVYCDGLNVCHDSVIFSAENVLCSPQWHSNINSDIHHLLLPNGLSCICVSVFMWNWLPSIHIHKYTHTHTLPTKGIQMFPEVKLTLMGTENITCATRQGCLFQRWSRILPAVYISFLGKHANHNPLIVSLGTCPTCLPNINITNDMTQLTDI